MILLILCLAANSVSPFHGYEISPEILQCKSMSSTFFELPDLPTSQRCRFALESEGILIACYDPTTCTKSAQGITFLSPKGFRLPKCQQHMAGDYKLTTVCNTTSHIKMKNFTLFVYDRPTRPTILYFDDKRRFECFSNSTSYPVELRKNISYTWRVNDEALNQTRLRLTFEGDFGEVLILESSHNQNGTINITCLATEAGIEMEAEYTMQVKASKEDTFATTTALVPQEASERVEPVVTQGGNYNALYIVAAVLGAAVLLSTVVVMVFLLKSRKGKVQTKTSTTTITFKPRFDGSMSNVTSSPRLDNIYATDTMRSGFTDIDTLSRPRHNQSYDDSSVSRQPEECPEEWYSQSPCTTNKLQTSLAVRYTAGTDMYPRSDNRPDQQTVEPDDMCHDPSPGKRGTTLVSHV